jgi:hypothetical protein
MPLLFISVLPPPHADSNTAAAQTPVSVVTEKARRVVDTNLNFLNKQLGSQSTKLLSD